MTALAELRKIIKRQPGESTRAYAAFMDYSRLGPRRSARKLIKYYADKGELGMLGEPGVDDQKIASKFTVTMWSVKYEWVKRSEAWDELQQIKLNAQWERRYQKLREVDWQSGDTLRGLATQMLEIAPQFIKTTRKRYPATDHTPEKEVITQRFDEDFLIKLIETASKLQTRAVGVADNESQPGGNTVQFFIEAVDYRQAVAALAPLDFAQIEAGSMEDSPAPGEVQDFIDGEASR